MDHAIDCLTEYAALEARELKKEYDSGEYENVRSCPSYEKIKAYADAINRLTEFYAPDWECQTPEGLADIYERAD